MPSFSSKSKERLMTCEDRLQKIMFDAIAVMDFTILEGHRTVQRQKELLEKGVTKVEFSNHNYTPSKAIDIAPWPIPDNWGEGNSKEMAKFYFLAGVIFGIADKYNIKLRWGGDWDSDEDFDDQTFDDLVHFELVD